MKLLYRVSPLGVVGATVTGLMLGAFYALGAVYVRRLGMDLSDTAFFMSMVILGGVGLQWPLGWLSDRFDRRLVIIGSFISAFLICITIAAIGRPGGVLLLLGALFGGVSFALYPLCVAHTNDRLSADERVGASGGLVLSYSVGAAIGPLSGAAAMAIWGSAGLFIFIGACAMTAAGVALWRQWAGTAIPNADLPQGQDGIGERTAILFAVIANTAGSLELHWALGNAAARLGCYRRHEESVLDEAFSELTALETLVREGSRARLMLAIERYHDRRRAVAGDLVHAARYAGASDA